MTAIRSIGEAVEVVFAEQTDSEKIRLLGLSEKAFIKQLLPLVDKKLGAMVSSHVLFCEACLSHIVSTRLTLHVEHNVSPGFQQSARG